MNNPEISQDPESIKQVWGIKPYTVWQVMCMCCGSVHTFDMTVQDAQEALIDDEWEFRRTGPWCPGCCEDQRQRADAIMREGDGEDFSDLEEGPASLTALEESLEAGRQMARDEAIFLGGPDV